MSFVNTYEDPTYAGAYARLDFPGTYLLVARDLPPLLARHRTGDRALDFGCGAGRSTRLLRDLGFEPVGVDISPAMIDLARAADPSGDYRLLAEHDPGPELPGPVDLALCAWPFDNVPGWERKVGLLRSIRAALAPVGRAVNIVSTPDMYINEWTSFTTADFPENSRAEVGDVVRIVTRGFPGAAEDVLWTETAWREVYRRAGLAVVETCRPLGRAGEGVAWVSEATVPPWTIHVLEDLSCSC